MGPECEVSPNLNACSEFAHPGWDCPAASSGPRWVGEALIGNPVPDPPLGVAAVIAILHEKDSQLNRKRSGIIAKKKSNHLSQLLLYFLFLTPSKKLK